MYSVVSLGSQSTNSHFLFRLVFFGIYGSSLLLRDIWLTVVCGGGNL